MTVNLTAAWTDLAKARGPRVQQLDLAAFGQSEQRTDPDWARAAPGAYQVGGAKASAKAYAGGKTGIDHFYAAAGVYQDQAHKAVVQFREPNGTLRPLARSVDSPADQTAVPADLYELFTMPNPWMPWFEFMDLIIIDLLSVGNFFAIKHAADEDGKKPAALYRLPAKDVEIESTKARHINKFIYTPPSGKPVKFDPQQLLHLRLANPHSPYAMTGIGAVQAAPHAFDIELGLLEAQRNFFDKGTVLSGTLESDKTIPEPTRKKTLREFRNLYAGSQNWGKLAFLERGMRYRAIQANAMEAGYEALSKMSRERVFELVRVPQILAGIGIGGGDQTVQKGALDEGRRMFAEDRMQPFLNRIATVLTLQLVAAWNLKVEFDFAYVPPAEQRVQNAEKIATLPGVKVNQVLEAAGLPPLGPDEVDATTGEPIGDMVLNVPGPSTEGGLGLPDALSGSEGGRRADPENRTAFTRMSEDVNGRPASAADQARRARSVAPARATRRTGKALTSTELDVISFDERLELAQRDLESKLAALG